MEAESFAHRLLHVTAPVDLGTVTGCVINQDVFEAAPLLPRGTVDLLILDPPYNLTKDFNGEPFKERDGREYQEWFGRVVDSLGPVLRPRASIYVCADWKTSGLIQPVLERYFTVRNRITWERDKGRGAKSNWKNNTEDIWFCTRGDEYTFNVDAVKVKRKVIAPYRREDGAPKDWDEGAGGNYRLTHPSNIWTDITIPFWSMPENTDHPTQKPEKLIAKLVLASSNPGNLVLDPFLGSGTTAVVAKKLGRSFIGIERDRDYCCWALKRLDAAEHDRSIQGYSDGVFWERNSGPPPPEGAAHAQQELFG
ncbi:MAG: site-specific DNA-methyltransferase [Candidatus Hydrogenedentes bacterium]|nr:site-specific DNA-methyltransferase [Candidatus Hydrogenedentota bacterium]